MYYICIYLTVHYALYNHVCLITGVYSIWILVALFMSSRCGGYLYYKFWYHLNYYNRTHEAYDYQYSQDFPNPGTKTCSVIPCIDISPLSLSHNLCDWYLIVSQSSIGLLATWFSIYKFCNSSVLLPIIITERGFCFITMSTCIYAAGINSSITQYTFSCLQYHVFTQFYV